MPEFLTKFIAFFKEKFKEKPKERTEELRIKAKELETKNAKLERTNKLMTGRELKMIELKEEIKELKKLK